MMRRKRIRVTVGAVMTVALAVLVSGFFLARPHPVSARAATVPAKITISSGIGETFAPAPLSAAPALTAQQAWQRYAKHLGSSRTTIPSSVTARLGLFTLEASPADDPASARLPKSGGKAYIALNELAYGYSWHSCPVFSPGPASARQGAPASASRGARALAPMPHTPCIAWLFLNARTGRQIVQTWQM
jgi:hypothetical protein